MSINQFKNARILIIDEDPERAIRTMGLLHDRGYSTSFFETSPARTGSAFKRLAPDIVIVDLCGKPCEELRVIEQIKALVPCNTYLPVLVVTEETAIEAKWQALERGVTDYLVKPFNKSELLLRVRNLLQIRQYCLDLLVERDGLVKIVEERTLEAVSNENEILERLALVAEYRDGVSARHVRRVGVIVELLALELAFEPAAADLLGRAALLHDIGKIAVNDAVLVKPGSLTADEFVQVKTHARIGGDILSGSRSKVLRTAEIIARYHHERWNGTGYNGLAGKDIPIEARITGVADVFDALRGRRPYKNEWDHAAAVAEIRTLSGTHFDPEVTAAFLRIESKILTLYEEFPPALAA